MAMQQEIHSALRSLLRAQRLVFQGDMRAKAGARDLNRALLAPALESSTTPEEKTAAILGARQAAQYFRENVLQGVSKRKDDPTFALRILPSTALGDNDSIKNVAPAPSLSEIEGSMNRGCSGGSSTSGENNVKPVRRRRRTKTSESSAQQQQQQQAAETTA